MATVETPASLGFRMPAEWEEHEATWIGWPHNKSDWPGKFSIIPWVFGEIVRKLSAGEIVRIIVNSKEHEANARRLLRRVHADMSQIEFFRFPTNRGWTRDFGPMFVRNESEVAVTNFKFNAWAKYPDWKKDQHIHTRAAKSLGIRLFHPSYNGKPVVLEGGAIDVNGKGTLLTTEECLLDQSTQVRNPGLSRHDMEKVLAENLAATNVIWLGKGIAGDDTHGHVDDLCRFVNPTTVVLCSEENPTDANYAALQENRERLEGARLEDGSMVEVVSLPMPLALYLDDVRLPASYANFYISNAGVLVPTFNDPGDRVALGILSELFTDRPVIGIHAVDLVWGFGTLHCLTQQQPAL
ncbi:MAG: agmatine deiminase family protein [Bacteroidetes bacterium]|nr:agmatine deiminase family protein [Bacteroidota bacterium]MCW5895706.1 agmatine deiminase family protein [Bacteroidota bacterium]